MFSTRLPARLETNAFTLAIARARREGRRLVDLTVTNPTRAGIDYPPDVLDALADPGAAVYNPEPFGMRAAREAVAADYARRGVSVSAERIVLTSSTSEAYSFLFKLLCAPCGDAVLVPAPSYPLFEHLTRLDGVSPRQYRLQYDGRWWLDLPGVDAVWDARTRAVLAVSPNNPTGSTLDAAELAGLMACCASRGAALIVDEVFVDYPLGTLQQPAAGEQGAEALRFRLGGLSKSAALPQLKLGWIAVDGPAALVTAAMSRLEVICDAYLSVSTPVQVAAGTLIRTGSHARRQVQARVRSNYATLRRLAESRPAVDVLHADAGWSAVIRVPTRGTEEELVLCLLREDGVIVHPGFFFDFERESYVVVSLLVEPVEFEAGVALLLERVDG
jgi:aspartate/methionine/tyrosine aminotransferase